MLLLGTVMITLIRNMSIVSGTFSLIIKTHTNFPHKGQGLSGYLSPRNEGCQSVYPPILGLLVFPFQGTKKDGSYFLDKIRLFPLFYFADIFQECPKIKTFSPPDSSGLSG